MKKTYLFLLAVFATLGFAACSDNEDPQIGDKIKAPVLNKIYPQGLVITEETNLDAGLGYSVWSVADYGIPTQVNYAIEADTLGGNFSKPVTLTTTNSTSLMMTPGMLNKVAAEFITESKYVTLDLRVKAVVSNQVQAIYSNVENITFKAYVAVKPALYIIGDGLIGWDNARTSIGNNLQVLFSADSKYPNKVYTYVGKFIGGKNFKLITKAGNWDTAIAYENGKLQANNKGGDIPGPKTDGIYTLTVDLGKMEYTLTPYTKPIVSFDKLGVIGSGAKGWGDTDDIVMTKFAEHTWVVKTDLVVGAIKFRKIGADGKGDWGTNWGLSEDKQLPFGVGKPGGDDIKIEKAGTYFLSLNDLTGEYVVQLLDKMP